MGAQTNGRGAGRGAGRRRNTCEYRFFTEFQSHEAEFDYLKSLEIEEKINQIRWCKSSNSALFLLSTNGAFVPRRRLSPVASGRAVSIPPAHHLLCLLLRRLTHRQNNKAVEGV